MYHNSTHKNSKLPCKPLLAIAACITGLSLFFSACQTDGEFVDWQERTLPVKAEFKYMADPEVRYALEYAGREIADTLPYIVIQGETVQLRTSSDAFYLQESRANNLLRVYRLENGTRRLETEQEVTINPIPINRMGLYNFINLLQLSADAPVQLWQLPETPADSTAIAVQLFYGDARQADEVKITILAVDQYALLMKSNKLANVPDTMKTEVAELELNRAQLSGEALLNTNFYGRLGADGKPVSKGMAARFFYRVTGSDGTLIQDYDVANAEIKIASAPKTRDGYSVPFPTYKSVLMHWTYKSETIPFGSPAVTIEGDKW